MWTCHFWAYRAWSVQNFGFGCLVVFTYPWGSPLNRACGHLEIELLSVITPTEILVWNWWTHNYVTFSTWNIHVSSHKSNIYLSSAIVTCSWLICKAVQGTHVFVSFNSHTHEKGTVDTILTIWSYLVITLWPWAKSLERQWCHAGKNRTPTKVLILAAIRSGCNRAGR